MRKENDYLLNKRYYGVDAWRAVLLLGGPCVHAAGLVSTIGGGVRWLDAVGEGSHIFRMEAFFTLAGFLAGVSQQSGRSDWLKRRLIQLALPLAVAWFAFLPITDLTFTWCTGRHFWPDAASPSYLWFLVSLLLFSSAGWGAERRGWITALTAAAERTPVMMLGGAVLVWLAALGWYRLTLHWLKPEQGLLSILLGAPYFGWYYLAGFLTSRMPGLARRLSRSRAWPIGPLIWGVAVAFLYLSGAQFGPEGGLVRVTRYILAGLAGLAMCFTVLATALRTRVAPGFVRVVADAAFTIYLVHMPFVGLFAYALSRGADTAGGSLFVAVSLSATAASFAVHHCIVKQSPLAALLLNGRLPARLSSVHEADTTTSSPVS